MLIGVPARDSGWRDPRRRDARDGEEARRARATRCASQSGAGVAASVTDAAYAAAGAEITDRAGAFGCRPRAQGALADRRRAAPDEAAAPSLVGMLNPFDAAGLRAPGRGRR